MRLSYLTCALSAVLVVSMLTGCGGSRDDGPGGILRGEIVIDGSSTVFRISRAALIGYTNERENDVQVLLNNSGTGGGFGKYLEGEVDIIDASRPAKPEEEEQARARGLEWTRFIVGYDGITVVVNPENDFCDSLTTEQLRQLFHPDSTIQNWNQIDPSYPDLKIVFYTPDSDSGTFEFFTEAVIEEKNAQRKDVQASPDDNTLVTGVSGDRGAIGYFGYAYYAANQDNLKAISIQNGPDALPIAPTKETILAGTYEPLSRPLLIYVKNAKLRRPEMIDFLTYYITNIDVLATQGGYVPPMADDQVRNLSLLAEAAKRVALEPGAEARPSGDSAVGLAD